MDNPGRIEEHLGHSARRFGTKTALVAGSLRLTYQQLDEESARLATTLRLQGVRPGDRVVLLLENRHEAVTGLFAIWKAGAVACPLHPTTKPEKLGKILKSLEASAIIVEAKLLAAAKMAAAANDAPVFMIIAGLPPAAALRAISWDEIRYEEAMSSPPLAAIAKDGGQEALALIIHTSGSTGEPKGVMHSHASIAAACRSIVSYLGNTQGDVVLNVLPLAFSYGLTQVVTMAMVTGTLILEKSFAFPSVILKRLREERATGFPLVPPMAVAMTGMRDLEPGFLPDLRYVTSAAAAMPPAVTQRLRQLLPQARLYLMYGQSECIRATYLPSQEVARRPASAGIAIPGTRSFVIDSNGDPAKPGETGELVVRGPHVMLGYWKNEQASAKALRLGPDPSERTLLTGDLFCADTDGFLTFVGRRDDIIKTRGEKVSPQEVERALYAIKGVREAAVTGVADDFLGQAVKAFVVTAPQAGLSQTDILKNLSRTLEDYMLPKFIEFCDSLPRTASGKIRVKSQAGNATE